MISINKLKTNFILFSFFFFLQICASNLWFEPIVTRNLLDYCLTTREWKRVLPKRNDCNCFYF